MSDDLLTTIRFEVDASGMSSGITSVKRSIAELGEKTRAVTKEVNDQLKKIGDSDLDVGAKKATKAITREMGELAKQIAASGSTVQREFKNISKSADEVFVSLSGKGVPTSAIDSYIKLLTEAQNIAKAQAQTAAKAAAEQAAATQKLIAEEEHYAALKKQHAAFNKAAAEAQAQEAAKTAQALKEQTAALAAFKTEIQNAELNLTHFGRAKTAAFLQDKGARLGFDPAMVQAELAGLKKIEDANKAAFAAANPHIAELAKRAEAAGTSVKGLSANLRNVPAQLTDIVVSLQGGQAPLTVLLQQGGQLKDMFGGIGNAARALGGYVVSLINPFTLAAAAVGTLGYSYFQGSKELDEYRKALVLTGNAVGLTSGQMQDMARSMAAAGGTQTAASAALVAFVNAGSVGAESLEKFAQSAINFEKATGTAVEETAKQFAELGKNPLEAAIKLNESTNFLTASLYEQVKALDEQGKKTEAANVVQQAYADTLNQNTAQITANLGTIEKGWNAIASATKGAWDWMKNIGRDTGPEQQLSKLRAEIASKEAMRDAPMALTREKEEAKRDLKLLNDQYEKLSKQVSLAQIRATDRGIEAQAVKDKIEWDKSHQDQLAKLQQSLHKEVEDYARLTATGKADAATRLQYEQRIHHLVKQEADYLKGEYKTDLQKPKAGKAEKVEHFGKELAATKEWLATQERMLKDSYSTQQKDLEDSFKSQEITAAQYYARQLASDTESLQQREQLRAEAQARFDAEMAKRVAVTQARPESKAKSAALADLENEAKNFTAAQEAARQKDINSMAKHSSSMALEIDKESKKVTGSVDAYIADMQRKAEADAKLLAAREAMAGQSPEIIAGMEAELKVRADAAGLLDKTAEAYALAAKNAREYESELQSQYDSGKEVTTAQIRMLEELKAAAVDSRIALMKLGGAVDTSAMEASITATAASVKKQTDEVAKEVQKTLVDGIMSAGKDGGAGLRKALEDVLVTKPFRIVVEAMLQPVSSAIAQGIMGQSIGGVAGATGFQTAMNTASLAVSNFGSTLIGTAANVATGGATLAQTWAAGSAMMNTAGGTMTGIAMKIGASAPYIAAAAVAANSLSNAIERANGSVTAAGIFAYGRNSVDGFKTGGRADFIQVGGGGTTPNSSWFDPGEETSKYMSAMGDLVTKSVKGWADAIGLSADAVNGYTETVQAAIGNGMSKAEERQSIDKAMAGYGDAMVQALFGQIMAFANRGETPSGTLERLGNDVTAVNNILRDNGKALYDTSFESAKAVQVLINSVGGLDKFKELAGTLETVNSVMMKLGKSTFELSMDGAKAANDLAKSVGGTAKLSELADGLIHVNENLAKLGEPLLDISVASARTAHTMLTATDNAVKALEAAERLEASYASFVSNLSNADTSSVSSLQAAFNRALAAVTVSIPTIKGVADLTGVTQDQYSSYNDQQRSKLDAAASAYKSLQTAIDSAAKSAESAAKTAKDAADAAVKAYSDALKAIEKDTRNVNRELADFGKTDFQKKLAKIGYDSQDKLAELDELSAKAAELSAVSTSASLKATEATLGAVSTMTDGLITASQDLSADAQKVAANVQDALGNSVAAFGDALEFVPAIASLFDEILKGLQKIPPVLTLVANAVTGIGNAANTASGGLTAFGAAVGMAGSSATSATGPITSVGAAFNAVSPAASAAGAALNALGGAFDTASSALNGLTGTFGAASAAVDGLNAAFGAAATGLGGLSSAFEGVTSSGANLAGTLGSIGGALSEISGAAASAAGGISSAASSLASAASAAASVQVPIVTAPSLPVIAKADGGAIYGPGTATSDSIPAMLSNGEYVIKASSVSKYGTRFLDALNSGNLRNTIYRAGGGPVYSNADAHQQSVALDEFSRFVTLFGGVIKRFEATGDSFAKVTVTAPETYTQALSTFNAAKVDFQGMNKEQVSKYVLDLLAANKPTWNDSTQRFEVNQDLIAVMEKFGPSAEALIKGLDEIQPWKDKLAVLSGDKTQRQIDLQADLAKATDDTTKALIKQVYAQEDQNKLKDERQGLQDQLDALTMTSTELLQKQRDALDASNQSLFDNIQATKAENAAKDTVKKLIDERQNINVGLLTAKGDKSGAEAAQRYIDLEPMLKDVNDSRRQEITTLYDTNAAIKKQIEVLSERKGLQEQLDSLTMTSTQLLEKQRTALDASNQSLFDSIQGAKVSKENAGWQDKIATLIDPARQQEIEQRDALAAATDDTTKALIKQYYAQLDLNKAATATQDYTRQMLQAQGAAGAKELAAFERNLDTKAKLEAGWTQVQIDNLNALTDAAKAAELAKVRESWQDRANVLNNTSTAQEISLKNDLAGVTDEATRSLIKLVHGLEAVKDATDKVTAAQNALDQAQSAVKSIQSAGTNAYISALDAQENAQKRVAEVIAKTAQDAYDAAVAMRDLGKTMREFVENQTAQTDSFANVLKKALAGDKDAMKGLTASASAAITKAEAQAPDVALAKAKILADVMSVATLAESTILPAKPETVDPLIAANAELTKANMAVAEALRVANAIQASLVRSPDDLIAQYTAAKEKEAKAQTDLMAAQKVLEDIKKNTEDTNLSVEDLNGKLVTELSVTAKSEIEKLITFVTNTDKLPDDLKKLALEVAGTITKTVELVAGSSMTGDLKNQAFGVATDITRMVELVAGSSLSTELMAQAFGVATNISRLVDLVAGSSMTDELKAQAFGVATNITRLVEIVAGSSMTPELKNQAFGVSTDITRIVSLVASSSMTTELKDQAFGVATDITRVVGLVAGSSLSSELKTVAFGAATDLTRVVGLIAGSSLSTELKTIAFGAASSITRVVDLVAGYSLSTDLKNQAFGAATGISRLVEIVAGSSMYTELKAQAFGVATNISRTLELVAGYSLSTELKTQAFGAATNITRFVELVAGSSLLYGDLKSQAFGVATNITRYVEILAGSSMSPELKSQAFDLGKSISRTLELVAGSSVLYGDLKAQAFNAGSLLTRTLNIVAGFNTTDEIKKQAFDAGTTLSRAVYLFESSNLSPDIKKLALGQATDAYTRTIQAIGGTLTADQKAILQAAVSASSNVNLSASIVFAANDPLYSIFRGIAASGVVQSNLLVAVHNAIATLSQGKWVTYLNNVFTTPQADQALLSLKSASGVYAKGGAFDGGVQAFASGGVVTGPTYAPIALFGEAGPEAIMPLHRDESGSLGVKATLQMPQMPQQQGNIFLLEELRALRREVAELRASNTSENVAIAIHAANTASSTRKMERNGVQVWTDPAEPILTQVAA